MAKKRKRRKKAYICTFIYDVDLEFHSSDGDSYEFLPAMISYILVEHDFEKRVMPCMYMKLKILPSVYNKMVPDQGQGKMYVKLYRTQLDTSTSSVRKVVIRDEFDYYMTDDPNTYKELETAGEENGNSYRVCTIGLIKTELQTLNKKPFEGVFKNTNMVSLVQEATKHMGDIVIQPFVYNTPIMEFSCPAVPSVGQFLSYLNSQYSFYNGSYIYYLDFDKIYIRSNDGSYIDVQDGDNMYVAFDIRDLTDYQSFAVGMVNDKSQSAYIIYVSANDATIDTNRETSDLVGNVQAVNNSVEATAIDPTGAAAALAASQAANGQTQQAATTNVSANVIDTSAITGIESKMDATIMVSSGDPNAAKYVATNIAEKAVKLTITKSDMDSRIFTPNKQYLLCNYNDNQKYCGIYYLVKKQEIYLRTGDQLTSQMIITMRKAADFVQETAASESGNSNNSTTESANLV